MRFGDSTVALQLRKPCLPFGKVCFKGRTVSLLEGIPPAIARALLLFSLCWKNQDSQDMPVVTPSRVMSSDL